MGLTEKWSSRDIQLFGRNSISGTYSYFKKKALCKGDYKKELTEQPGSAAIIESIASSINSIGYSGIGYKTAGVRIVPLSKKEGEPYLMPTTKSIETGNYPLSRFLYIYINKKTNMPLPALEKEFIKLILSQQGQKSVVKDGYIPLPASVIKKTLQAIE